MQTTLTWLGRAALLAVLAVAFAGAIDPHHNAARNVPAPDVVEHVAYGYLLTLLTIISLPRISPLWIGAGFLALGVKDVNQRYKVRFVMDNADDVFGFIFVDGQA